MSSTTLHKPEVSEKVLLIAHGITFALLAQGANEVGVVDSP